MSNYKSVVIDFCALLFANNDYALHWEIHSFKPRWSNALGSILSKWIFPRIHFSLTVNITEVMIHADQTTKSIYCWKWCFYNLDPIHFPISANTKLRPPLCDHLNNNNNNKQPQQHPFTTKLPDTNNPLIFLKGEVIIYPYLQLPQPCSHHVQFYYYDYNQKYNSLI